MLFNVTSMELWDRTLNRDTRPRRSGFSCCDRLISCMNYPLSLSPTKKVNNQLHTCKDETLWYSCLQVVILGAFFVMAFLGHFLVSSGIVSVNLTKNKTDVHVEGQ